MERPVLLAKNEAKNQIAADTLYHLEPLDGSKIANLQPQHILGACQYAAVVPARPDGSIVTDTYYIYRHQKTRMVGLRDSFTCLFDGNLGYTTQSEYLSSG